MRASIQPSSCALGALGALLLALPAGAAARPCDGPSPGYDPDRPIASTVTIPEEGRATRRVLLALTPRCTAAAAAAVARDGGVVEYQADAVGYLRFRLATFPLDRLGGLPGIEAAYVAPRYSEMVNSFMATLPVRHRWRESGETPAGRPRSIAAGLPYDNPHTLAAGMGAELFIRSNPSHDGRGVTVAVIDSGVDPAMPQLSHALDLAGRPVRKIADLRSSLDPRIETSGGGWVSMDEIIDAPTGETRHRDRLVRLPAPGRYRIGALDEASAATPADLAQDIDGDGNPAGRDIPFLVLWRESDNFVWVDADRDGDFSDERALTDFSVAGHFAYFRPRQLSPDRAGPTAFAVQTDPGNRAVAVLIGTRHNAMSASSAVGSRFFGGEAGGVAPGARLVNISIGSGSSRANSQSEAALYQGLEALLMALADPRVDVVSYYAPGERVRVDGRSVFERITRRAVRHYAKPVVSAANNTGPTLGTLAHSGDEALLIGAYTAAEALAANNNVRIGGDGLVRTYSARGPADDGGIGPSLLAPTGFVVADSTHARPRQGSNAPHGYQLGGGTSQATPAAAGAVALLVSAARQAGIAHDQVRIAAALLTSARWVEGYGAHEQGAGLIDIPAAWAVLNRLAESPPEFRTVGPVVTRAARVGALPASGRGLYEREGWRAGQTGDRTIRVERLSGPRGRRRYAVELRGNDGTFSAPGEILLARGRERRLAVRIAPERPGVHSALLRLIDPGTGAVVHQTLLTIVAAEPLEAGAPLVRDMRLGLMRPRSLFVAVPERATSLTVRATVPATRFDVGLANPGAAAPVIGQCREGAAGTDQVLVTCSVSDPAPGVWEIYADWPIELSPDRVGLPDGEAARNVRVEVEARVSTPPPPP